MVGHDSGGLIARHALAGDPRLRAMGLIDTEQPHGLSWRFRSFLAARHLPGFGAVFGWLAGRPRLRRNRFVLGDAFVDSIAARRRVRRVLPPTAAHVAGAPPCRGERLLRSFDLQHVRDLAELHRRIDVPVQLVWGEQDPFFPVEWAEEMVATFPDARLHVIEGAGLFSHEERPAEVARALLPVLARSGSS